MKDRKVEGIKTQIRVLNPAQQHAIKVFLDQERKFTVQEQEEFMMLARDFRGSTNPLVKNAIRSVVERVLWSAKHNNQPNVK
jgi:hypothetical protein